MHDNRIWSCETSYELIWIIACCYVVMYNGWTLHSVFDEVKSFYPAHYCYYEILQKLSEGYDNHCRTKNLTWSIWANSPIWWQTYIVPITNVHNIMTMENFHKYNLLNDHVIMKLRKFSTMKIWHYTVINDCEAKHVSLLTSHVYHIWVKLGLASHTCLLQSPTL